MNWLTENHRGDERKPSNGDNCKERHNVNQATCCYLCNKEFAKEKLQGEGPLLHNKEMPRDRA